MTSPQNIISQNQKKHKLVQITQTSEAIHVSADKLWEIVGPGFADAGKWSTAVDHSVGSGQAEFAGATYSHRACDLNAKGFNKVKEVVTLYDENTQEFAYDVIEGFPGFVKKASNHWQVKDLGNGRSALEMTITMELTKLMGFLMGGMMKNNIKKTIPTIFRDLKVYAETGDVSKEKKERMVKLAMV